ncbi:type II secretion system protein GspG [Aureliella helgolandensis]|uniref:Type II secretion system protein G n=1 Tax=Aureliella helgolandensis TaxID=2527968 RepID=A0A518G318_9BACT|nr:type II secretion system protein GspG [Aureliella helgolandensis]QDV22984.1 Type II secretion system protein G precursor [Aureliella helgolandensis]
MPRKLSHSSARRSGRRSAFTLLEVMLVLVIIAAIAGIAVVNIGGFQTRALTKAAKAQMDNYEVLLDSYKLEAFSYPQSLDALYEKPSDLADESKWFQQSKEPIKPDPWGHEYEYTSDGATYELKSMGPDGQSGTEDDIES